MKADLECYFCCMKKAASLLEESKDDNIKMDIMKDIFYKLGIVHSSEPAPVLMAGIMRVLEKNIHINESYRNIKMEYNNLLLLKEEHILKKINSSNDKLLSALQFAMTGNYIDFGAMDSIDNDKLENMLNCFSEREVHEEEYLAFKKEIANSGEISYITDNCGEIVLDKIFIEVIKILYPKIKINVVVRGIEVLNDATVKDAIDIGLTHVTEVFGNGSDVPGTDLNSIDQNVRNIIKNSDLVIAKGQGNFETLSGCGLNIYYIFLCKCDLFVKKFNMEKFSGIFVNEKNLNGRFGLNLKG